MLQPHQQQVFRNVLNDLKAGNLPYELQNPSFVRPRGRRTAAAVASANANRAGRSNNFRVSSVSSTQRDPSGFEYVAQQTSGGSQRRCGSCQQTGHNTRTCPVRQSNI